MESTTPGKGVQEKSSAGSSPAPSAIYGFYEDQYPSYEDKLFHELQDPNPVKAEEVNRLVARLKTAERINKHVKEHMDLLMNALWEAQQAYDKLRDELGLNPLFDPKETEDLHRDKPGLENQGSGVRIPGLPPFGCSCTYDGHITDRSDCRLHRPVAQADGAEPIGEDDGCNPLEEGSIPSGTSINGPGDVD